MATTARTKPVTRLGVNRRWATTAEAAEHLGVTTRTIRQMVSDGRLTAYTLGPRVVRLDLNEIDAAMNPSAAS